MYLQINRDWVAFHCKFMEQNALESMSSQPESSFLLEAMRMEKRLSAYVLLVYNKQQTCAAHKKRLIRE